MKKIVNIIVAILLLTILCISCSKEICPAYGKVPAEQVEEANG